MLVLTRKKGETVIISDNIEITILDIKGDQIRVGIIAPKDIPILRKEVYLAVKEENKVAVATSEHDLKSIAEILINNKE